MRFQLKLLIALIASIAAVTLFSLWETGKTVRATYQSMFAERFRSQVATMIEARQERLLNLTEICERMATSGLIVDTLRRPEDRTVQERLREDFAKLVRARPEQAPRGPGGKLQPAFKRGAGAKVPVAGVFDDEGRIRPISGIRRRGTPAQHDGLQTVIRSDKFDSPQVGYMSLEDEEGRVLVRESIATPVLDPDSGALLGGLLIGNVAPKLAGAITDGKNSDDEAILSGVLTGGELKSNSISGEIADELLGQIRNRIDLGEDRQFTITDSAGASHQVFFPSLNEGSAFPEAYQVALYPLAGLMGELSSLRSKVIQIALLSLLAATVLAWLIARSLSIPVQALSQGTEAIRRGDLGARVPVRSGDELGKLAHSFNEMAEGLALKEQYREVLGKVADQSVAQALVEGELELGGERRVLSVLFCDIRGFTELSAGRAPDEMIDLLNDHMTAMTEVVYGHGGVVDKYVGDLVMAIFGAPKSYGGDTENALRCALAMLERRRVLNAAGGVPIEIGIGVATGEMVVGMMGSEHRQDYTVIGDRVNLGSRLTDAAGVGEVVVDSASVEAIGRDRLELEERSLNLKGYSGSVTGYRLLRIADPVAANPA